MATDALLLQDATLGTILAQENEDDPLFPGVEVVMINLLKDGYTTADLVRVIAEAHTAVNAEE